MRRGWTTWTATPAVRAHPDRLLEGVRSVVVVSFVYGRPEPSPPTATAGEGRAVCPGGRLSRGPLAAARRPARLAPGRVSRGARPRRRRHRPAARARLRAAGRARLDRQEHDADRPPAGELHRARRPARRRRAAARRAPRRRPLRDLHPLPRRLPDRRLRRPLSARRPALHQLLDHRAQGADRRRRSPTGSTTGPSAATSARTSAPGTARRPRAGRPSSSRGPSGPTPT